MFNYATIIRLSAILYLFTPYHTTIGFINEKKVLSG